MGKKRGDGMGKKRGDGMGIGHEGDWMDACMRA